MRPIFTLMLIAILTMPIQTQDDIQPDLQRHSWDVFIRRNAELPALTDMIFIDLLSGGQSVVSAAGERFTLSAGGLLFFDPEERQVKIAKADGIIRDHPFIKAGAAAHSVDWAVSGDGGQIVWTVSRMTEDGKLITATWLADAAGAEIRELLVYGPRAGIQLLPIAIIETNGEIFMEAHALGSGGQSPYRRRTGLFSLTIRDDELETRALPGDGACLCAVGFGANLMLRLAPNPDLSGLYVEIFDLDGGDPRVIPPLSRGDYNEAGNILLSADGKQAVYALSQIRETSTERDAIRTVLAHVDIENGRQRIASSPMPDLVRPLRFTDDNRAVLVTLEHSDATLKIDLEEGGLVEVAEAIYLGQLGDN